MYRDSQAGWLAPSLEPTSSHRPELLSGTGTTETVNEVAFIADRMHLLVVSGTDVRVGFFSSSPAVGSVPPDGGFVLPVGAIFPFRSTKDALFVVVEAADGSSSYEVSVWRRE